MSLESTATPGQSSASPGQAGRAEADPPHAGGDGAALSNQPWTLRVHGKERRVRSLRATLRNPWVWVATVGALATGFAGRTAYDMVFNNDRAAYVNALMQARRAAGADLAARGEQSQWTDVLAPGANGPGGAPQAAALASPGTAAPAAMTPPAADGMAASSGGALLPPPSSALAGVPPTAAGASPAPAGVLPAPGSVSPPSLAGVRPAQQAATQSPGAPLPTIPGGPVPALPETRPSGMAAPAGELASATTAAAAAVATASNAAGRSTDGAYSQMDGRADAAAHGRPRRHASTHEHLAANRRALFAPPPGIEPTPYGVGAGLQNPGEVGYEPAPSQAAPADAQNAGAAPRVARRPAPPRERERDTLSARERLLLAQRRHRPTNPNPSVIDALKNVWEDISSRRVVPVRPEDKMRP